MRKRKGILQSTRRKCDRLNNTAAENYFGPLKSELLYLPKFRFAEHFELEFVDHPGY